MSITLGVILLLAIYILYKLFIDGWLFKIILFIAGWFGLYWALQVYCADWAKDVAFRVGSQDPIAFTWASVVQSIVCFLCLLCTKVRE